MSYTIFRLQNVKDIFYGCQILIQPMICAKVIANKLFAQVNHSAQVL